MVSIINAKVVPRSAVIGVFFKFFNPIQLIIFPFQVYRHPNCLNKHRWEHTRQWREASKFVLSKHQQVQLLEVRL